MDRTGNPQLELMEVANSLELADELFGIGQFKNAATVYVTALGVLSRTFGEHDSDTIKCMQKAADSYYAAQNYADALPIYSRLLEAGKQILGEEHPDVGAMAAKVEEMRKGGPTKTGEMRALVAQGAGKIDDRASRLSYSSIAALRPEDVSPTDWNQDWRLTHDRLNQTESPEPPSAKLPAVRSFGTKAPTPPAHAQGTPAPNKAPATPPPAKPSDMQRFLASAAEAAGSAEQPASRTGTESPANIGKDGKHTDSDSSRKPLDSAPEQHPAPEVAAEEQNESEVAEEEVARTPEPKPRSKRGIRPAGDDGERQGVAALSGSASQNQLSMRSTIKSMLAVVPTAIVVIAVGWLGLTMSKLPTTTQSPVKAGATPKPKKYATIDSGKVIVAGSNQDANEASMVFAGNSEPLVMPLLYVGPDLKGFISACVSCASHKDVWLEKVPEGLRDEEGILYYSGDAPEFNVVREMRKVADTAARCYMAGTGYPKDKNYMQAFPYNVPTKGNNFLPVLVVHDVQGNDGRMVLVDPTSGEPNLFNSLGKPESAMWLLEPPPEPGAVHCLNARYSDAQPPRSEFYVHGFDRNGVLLRSSDPKKIFLLATRNGDDLNTEPHYQLPTSKTRLIRLCIVTLPQGFSLRTMHMLLPALMIAMAVLVFCTGQLSKPKGGLGFKLSSLDILSIILLTLGVIWGYLMLFAS